jgi:hypothetical protein
MAIQKVVVYHKAARIDEGNLYSFRIVFLKFYDKGHLHVV